MPLTFPTDPADGANLVNQRLDRYHHNRRPFKGKPGEPDVLPLRRPSIKPSSDVYAPHPAYELRMEHIINGPGLAAASYVGFHYVLESARLRPVALARVAQDAYGVSSMIRLSFGTYSRDFVPRLQKLAQHELVLKSSYEARCLFCKGIFFHAVWLKSNDGGIDLVYPLNAKQYPPKKHPPYPADSFIKALRPVAMRFIRGGPRTSIAAAGPTP